MPTRSGKIFSVRETSSPMDSNLQDTLNTIINKMKKMDQQLQEVRDQIDVNCKNLTTRFDILETNLR